MRGIEQRIKWAQSQCAASLLRSSDRVATPRIQLGSEIKRGRRRGIERQRALDGVKRCAGVLAEEPDHHRPDGERRRVIHWVRGRSARVLKPGDLVCFAETAMGEADLVAPGKVRMSDG